MPINALISQGIRPIGADLPQIGNLLNEKRQMDTRNALSQRGMAIDETNSQNYQNSLRMQQEGMEQRAQAERMAVIRQQAGSVLDNLQSIAGTPAYNLAVTDLQGNANVAAVARAFGIELDKLPDPKYLPVARSLVGMQAAPREVPFDQTEKGKELAAKFKFESQLQAQKAAAERAAGGGAYQAMTPEEVAAVGLPAGTSAQRGPDGKIDVLSKRDNTGALSQKDQTVARQKLTAVELAKQQLGRIKAAYQSGTQGINAFGPGQGLIPTQAGKKFDAAVDQMRSTLTALTRVPGVGAMSDYETKLDQAKFPARSDYESVTAEKIQGIEDMLALIENGYKGLLSGQASEASPAAPPAAPAAAPRRIRVDAQGNVIP